MQIKLLFKSAADIGMMIEYSICKVLFTKAVILKRYLRRQKLSLANSSQ